jgi:chromosome segregation ATPase
MGKRKGNRAEDQKRGTRRTEAECDSHPDGERNRQVRQLGRESANQPLGTDHPDRSGQAGNTSRLESLGGIYSQLLEEAEEQLAELEDRLEDTKAKAVKYEQRIERLQARRQQLLESLETWQQTLQEE